MQFKFKTKIGDDRIRLLIFRYAAAVIQGTRGLDWDVTWNLGPGSNSPTGTAWLLHNDGTDYDRILAYRHLFGEKGI